MVYGGAHMDGRITIVTVGGNDIVDVVLTPVEQINLTNSADLLLCDVQAKDFGHVPVSGCGDLLCDCREQVHAETECPYRAE